MSKKVFPSLSPHDKFPWCSDMELEAAGRSAIGLSRDYPQTSYSLNWPPERRSWGIRPLGVRSEWRCIMTRL